MKILAAVVTHNRKNLLERCLDHLDAQELKPDQILIINNDTLNIAVIHVFLNHNIPRAVMTMFRKK